MKLVEITPLRKSHLYNTLVRRETEIRKAGRGTFSRKGPPRARAAKWSHKRFKGSVSIAREDAEMISAKIRSPNSEDEGKLLKAFLGFVDRHAGNQVAIITIHYQ